MANLTVTREYSAGNELKSNELDDFKNSIETFFNSTGLNDDNIQNSGITASSKIISTSPIPLEAFQAGSVTTTKIQDAAVTQDKIADSAVATSNITNANVTRAKLSACNYSISSSINTGEKFNAISSPSLVGSVSITTTGRPVRVVLTSIAGSNINDTGIHYQVNTARYLSVGLKVGSNFIGVQNLKLEVPQNTDIVVIPSSLISFIDTPAAGTTTYSIYSGLDAAGSSGTTFYHINCKILAYEL